MPSTENYRPDLSVLIARLSGGRMGCARVLADEARRQAAGRDPGGSELHGRDLLTVPVTDQLLGTLLPRAELREDLTLLAPALEEPVVLPLWSVFGAPRLRGGPLAATARLRAAMDEVGQPHWNRDPWAWPADEPAGSPGSPGGDLPFVGDRALRALLLQQLANTGSPDRWSDIHRRLRAGYNPRDLAPEAVGHTVAYLHHTLALAELATVVCGLHDRLTRTGPGPWLAAVNVVCAAPPPPGGVPSEEQFLELSEQPEQPCPACAGPEPGELHRAIGQLVQNLWRASDPCTLARPDDIGRIGSALQVVYGQQRAAILRAGEAWPAALRNGVQAPHLPVPSGSTRSS